MPGAATKATGGGNMAEAARSAVAAVNVALPAVISSYDETTQSAVVHIVPCFKRKDPAQGGEIVCYQAPDIPGVPVAFPGSGDFSITWPLEAGDSGLLVFADRSMDEWLSGGGSDAEQQDPRRHDLTDGVFIPGLRSFAEPIPADGVDTSAMVVRGALIKLGSNAASSFVALDTLVAAQIVLLRNVFTAWTPAAGDGGAALKTLLTALAGAGWPASMASTKVQAE